MKNITILQVAMLLLVVIAGYSSSFAQFREYSSEHFETGLLPANFLMMHSSNMFNTRVVEYSSIPQIPGLETPQTGKFGVEFQTGQSDYRLCLVSKASLDRSKLGENGKALFQADVYIAGAADVSHTMSVVAMNADQQKVKSGGSSWDMYRFGVLQNENAFLSKSGEDSIYLHEKVSSMVPERDGWHRLQIIFQGRDRIECYIDGKMTSFSPVHEDSFGKLHPGFIVTAAPDLPFTAYMDNLSIQWTPDPDTPMPESPWLIDGGEHSSVANIGWETEAQSAWQQAAASDQNVLMLFYHPANVASQELQNNILQNSQQAQSLLNDCVRLRVDVNQGAGGNLVKEYGVIRVPTFLLADAEGNEINRLSMNSSDSWSVILPGLENLMRSNQQAK